LRNMVGLVLVSHSKKLAESVRQLVLQMTTPDFPVAVASGAGDDHDELGTDAVHIADVLKTLSRAEGILVLMDLGSAVLSAEAALELLDRPAERRIRLCAAPLVEGAIAAAVESNAGSSLENVAREAEKGLVGKQEQLRPHDGIVPSAESSFAANAGSLTSELILTVENEHGLHARPAAALVRAVSRYASSVQIINLTSGRGPASARSLTGLALLQIRKGDQLKVLAAGEDRNAAIETIRDLARAGFGEQVPPAVVPSALRQPRGVSSPVRTGSQPGGAPGSGGVAIGELRVLETLLPLPETRPGGDPAVELEKLNRAMEDVAGELSRKKVSFPSTPVAAAESAEILEAQALILSDPVLGERLKSRLEDTHTSAARAWIEVTEELATQYRSMEDAYLQERAADVRDIARCVLQKLTGTAYSAAVQLDRPAILFARELLPGEAAGCNPATVLGVITREGSATSHSAILLRTLGIPMVVGAVGIDEHAAGHRVAIDGATGEVWIEPDERTLAALEERRRTLLEREKQTTAARLRPSVTQDGVRIEVLANVGKATDASTAAENGAEGVGLLRTEFLFLERSDAPSEEEQASALRDIFARISGTIIVRTLDVGADKPLPFLPRREEHNPYLGLRGIRLCLRAPELFLPHLRSILAAGVGRATWLMFPMVSTVGEVEEALQVLEQAHRELASLGRSHLWPIKRGAMIEVPSAALLSESLAEKLDFFSIGTNDLTQYVMAAERGNAVLAELQDSLHPAVLQLIKTVVDGARARERHVSVCGDAASDPLCAAIFVGLGIRGLSVRPKQVAEIKALFRNLKMADLERLAEESLRCRDAVGVRDSARNYLDAVSALNGQP
jgi:phosphocarrier protein FPr